MSHFCTEFDLILSTNVDTTDAPKHSRTAPASVGPSSVQKTGVTRTDGRTDSPHKVTFAIVTKKRKTDYRFKTNAVPQRTNSVGSDLLLSRPTL